ncbi:TetR/AcrR family transcriptional regulator [Glycomyces mayteni]|uniref:TetR/AcrR family transcriptional regulator n=1 Tax=Glycomyces mayteni TaxID=543887 RepID=A0ABW2DE17_9ACTN|nr:TetR/AcrR family transcriptional regulator [Glycomyces mayteni]
MSTSTRASRVAATREAIIAAAERLFAEQGVAAVSNRQISEAAGQGNNTAVGYHFGTKADLVRAIIRGHMEHIERARVERLDAMGEEPGLREWVECFVMPTMDHLGALGERTWFARFAAQVLTDPAMRDVIAAEAMEAPSLRQVTAGLNACLPDLPPEVRAERDEMVRQLVVIVPAAREARIAGGAPTARDTWHEAGLGLVDAIVGLYGAEYTELRELPP